jgi:flavodoxin
MNIGIIVHSHTGNTLSVATKLAQRLQSQGHRVDLHKLEVVGGENTGESKPENIALAAIPDPASYDALVFAGPVRGFSISPAMARCFSLLPFLLDKKVAVFVTQQFPKPWLGGTRAVGQYAAQLKKLGAVVSVTGIVNWSNKKREQMIETVVTSVCGGL